MANWFPSPEYYQHSSLPLIIPALSLISLLTLSVLLLLKSRTNRYSSFPPGPPTLPLLGNLHQLTGPTLPHHTLARLSAKYGPVMRLHLGEWFAVVVSSPDAAKEVLRTKELSFPQRAEVLAVEIMSYDHSSLVFAPYGDYWRRLRRICVSELLSPKRVASFRSIREEEVEDLVAAISSSSGGVINLSELIFLATNNVTSRSAFGKRCRDSGEFLTLLQQVIRIAGGFNLPDLYPSFKFLRKVTGIESELKRIHGGIDRILEDIVNQHLLRAGQVDGQEDLLDILIKLQGSGQLDLKLTANHLKAITLDIFSAGSETSATTMEWAMAELMKNPTTMKKAQTELRKAFKGKPKIEENDLHHHDLTYLRALIKETLRLHPPGPLLPRECVEPCEVGGFQIPLNAKIFINAYAIGRDPKIWPEPNCFVPERFVGSSVDFVGSNFELIPFGGGRRICPGISFATANIELALARMLYHFEWSLPEGMKAEDVDMSESNGITARKKVNLQLVPTVSVPFSIS
ncbi:Desmethyl-deoxy-podophyllotoxin synthase [Linum grandiflorum]